MATIDPASTKRPLDPPDRALVAETIHTRLPFHGTFKTLLPLAGDASNRRYFRIDLSGDALRSVVLMQLAEPEAFKQSEEAVSGAPHAIPRERVTSSAACRESRVTNWAGNGFRAT